MVNDTSNNTSPATEAAEAPQAEMDDILSSIRSGVAEEGSKVGSGSADLIDAAAEADGGEEDDVLELSETDMAPVESEPAETANAEELIDLDAFAASGEAKPADSAKVKEATNDLLPGAAAQEILKEEPKAEAEGEASDEFDRLLAEISQEQQQQVEASKVSKEALMAEEEPLGLEPAPTEDGAEEASKAEPLKIATPEVDEGVEEMPMEEIVLDDADTDSADTPLATNSAAKRFDLGSIEGPDGVQVTFPAEVLAMALRPMVQEWLAKNLPDVVEKLVKEEISKLAQN